MYAITVNTVCTLRQEHIQMTEPCRSANRWWLSVMVYYINTTVWYVYLHKRRYCVSIAIKVDRRFMKSK